MIKPLHRSSRKNWVTVDGARLENQRMKIGSLKLVMKTTIGGE